MNLLDYMKCLTSDQLADLADRCDTSVGHLKQIAYGYRRASAGAAILIDRSTSGQVTCEVLRPDIDWSYLRTSGAKAA